MKTFWIALVAGFWLGYSLGPIAVHMVQEALTYEPVLCGYGHPGGCLCGDGYPKPTLLIAWDWVKTQLGVAP